MAESRKIQSDDGAEENKAMGESNQIELSIMQLKRINVKSKR
jgi:hypothetical protein